MTVLTAYEGVGSVLAGAMSEAELRDLERACAPTLGSCPGQFTANTMAMVSETLGLALPGSAMLPAVYSERLALARRAGRRVTEILRDGGPLPRDLVTRKSLENAAAAVAATGGSTNAGLHLPAIAHEAGIRFTLDDVAEVFARTPLIADLQPGGRYLAVDLHRAGGTDAVLKALLDGGFLHGDALTLSGQTLAEHLAGHAGPDGEIVRPASQPLQATGGLVVLRGNLAPDGALIKIAGLKSLAFEGIARVFDGEEACFCRRLGARLPRGRRADHPQRGAEGRARHARDAGRHGADLRAGHGRKDRPRHRRALLGRNARHDGGLRRSGGGRRRPDRAGPRRRSRAHRLRCAHAST